MGALTIAFDTTIVGALSLPWVLLVIHLFFFEGEGRLKVVMRWARRQGAQAAAGVLLFAVTYTLGSAVSRIAKDAFDDDDSHFQIDGRLLRLGVAEDRIITSVYCEKNDNGLITAQVGDTALAQKITYFLGQATGEACGRTMRLFERHRFTTADNNLIAVGHDIFGLEESTLLLMGEDPTLRLRQLHDQIMVLRGVTFNGIVGFWFCLLWCAVMLRREHPGPKLLIALLVMPALCLAWAVISFAHHLEEAPGPDPPLMEFVLAVLGIIGFLLVMRKPTPLLPSQSENAKKQLRHARNKWACFTLISLALTFAGYLAWWSTETIYTEQVIDSYSSLQGGATHK